MARDGAALRAVIYVPASPESSAAWTWLRICAEHCWEHGREIVAAVVGGRWEDAAAMVDAGEADTIVIGRWADVPPGIPRIEAALTWGDSSERP